MHESAPEKRQFTTKLIQITERKSRELARELYDDFNQELVIVAMELTMIEREVEKRHVHKLHSVRKRIDRLIQNTRSLARRLHPSIVDDLGLRAALNAQFEAFETEGTISFTCEELPGLSSEVSLCIYRIAQEAVRNAVKHSGQNQIQVRLFSTREHVILTVQDLGRGFDVNEVKGKGLGLTLMAERVELLGGELIIRSAHERGTLIRACIPVAVQQEL